MPCYEGVIFMKLIELDKANLYNDEETFEFADSEKGARIFRNFIEKQKIFKKQKNPDLCIDIYYQLSTKGKYVVDNAILDFIPDDIREQHFGDYFSALLNETKDYSQKQMTLYTMAKYIAVRDLCPMKDKNESYSGTIATIRSHLASFQSKNKSQDDSWEIEEAVCDIFSCDIDVLKTGKGYRYDINWDYVLEQLPKRNMSAESFFDTIAEQYLECTNCSNDNCCKVKKCYIHYKSLDKYSLAEFISGLLKIDLNNILLKSAITFLFEDFPFKKYYGKLSQNLQLHINNLICNIYTMEHSIKIEE